MLTYYRSDSVQEHYVENRTVSYKTKFLRGNTIRIFGKDVAVFIKYGPDLERPDLNRVNTVPMNIVDLLEK